jgi:hypothetical protein
MGTHMGTHLCDVFIPTYLHIAQAARPSVILDIIRSAEYFAAALSPQGPQACSQPAQHPSAPHQPQVHPTAPSRQQPAAINTNATTATAAAAVTTTATATASAADMSCSNTGIPVAVSMNGGLDVGGGGLPATEPVLRTTHAQTPPAASKPLVPNQQTPNAAEGGNSSQPPQTTDAQGSGGIAAAEGNHTPSAMPQPVHR